MKYWFAVLAPAGLPADVSDKWHAALAATLAHPEVKRRLAELGITQVAMTPEQLQGFIAEDRETWANVVKRKRNAIAMNTLLQPGGDAADALAAARALFPGASTQAYIDVASRGLMLASAPQAASATTCNNAYWAGPTRPPTSPWWKRRARRHRPPAQLL